MTPEAIFQQLVEKFGGEAVFDFHGDAAKDKDPWFYVDPQRIQAIGAYLRDEPALDCDYLECVTGIDFTAKQPEKERIGVVYHLYSYAKKHRVVMKVLLPREEPSMPTLSGVWSSANWQERECYDLLGVRFVGHPDLRRILLPDDWIGYPLRKDFVEQGAYHGIPTTRPSTLDLLKISLPAKEAAKA